VAEQAGGGVLDPAAVAQTAGFIAATQLADGRIPWFTGGHTDPWDHVEAAMGLDVAGRHERARAAYEWLRDSQNDDGSWYRGYRDDAVTDTTREANFAAYPAVGVWHHYLSTGDRAFLESMWPVVAAGVDFALTLREPGGQVRWAYGPDGFPAAEALLTGCSSIHHGLRCAVAIADLVGDPRPDWELDALDLGHALTRHLDLFADRDRFSMDWYYPVLGGALRGRAGIERLDADWDRFVVPGLGARCVADRPWVTAAESSELVLSLAATGRFDRARELLGWVQRLRHTDGSYWTGYVYPDDALWPDERTTWTAGAVLLADAALRGAPATVRVFDVAGPAVPAQRGPADVGDRPQRCPLPACR
jgi:hypothetical protein